MRGGAIDNTAPTQAVVIARLGAAGPFPGYICGSSSVGDLSVLANWAAFAGARTLGLCPPTVTAATLAAIDANTTAVNTAVGAGAALAAGAATLGLYKTSATQFYTVPINKAPGASIGLV
jgi:hypothetical protein